MTSVLLLWAVVSRLGQLVFKQDYNQVEASFNHGCSSIDEYMKDQRSDSERGMQAVLAVLIAISKLSAG
jgi:hypothetical protein